MSAGAAALPQQNQGERHAWTRLGQGSNDVKGERSPPFSSPLRKGDALRIGEASQRLAQFWVPVQVRVAPDLAGSE